MCCDTKEVRKITRLGAFLQLKVKLNMLKEKLVTNEDPFHVHKTLGILCLISFIFRFANVGEHDMGFDSYPSLTLPTMFIHLMLNLSSLVFRIPKKRISHGGRIWPEYRLHSLVFQLRSQITMALYLYEKHNNLEPNYDLNSLIVLGTFALTDIASLSVEKKYRSNTVRGVAIPGAIRFFISVLIVNGTAQFLFGHRRMTFAFLPIFATQITAFMGTLQRKNLIGYSGVAIFTMFLINSNIVQTFEYNRTSVKIGYIVKIIAFSAAIMRLSVLPKPLTIFQNKYVLWTILYFILRHYRDHVEDFDLIHLQGITISLIIILVFSGYHKVVIKNYYKSSDAMKTI